MKGKILIEEEVKNLKDGTKVYVEELEDFKPRLFKRRDRISEKKDFPFMRLDEIGTNLCIGLNNGVDKSEYIFYEWIE